MLLPLPPLSFIFVSSSSFFLLLLLLLVQGSCGLKVTGLVVPSEVNLGSDVQLECHYDLEGSNLYALKWYKGSHEFYRFVWKEVPPVSTFPWADVVIHTEETWPIRRASETDAGRVLLKNVTSAVEGIYKCEVSTEAPTFDTDYRESTISIVEVSSNQPKPVIRWLNDGQIDWQVNDVLHFRCDMNGTRPVSELSWLVNGQAVAPEMVDNHETPRFGRGRYHNSRSDLRLHMEEKLLTSTSTASSVTVDGGDQEKRRSSNRLVVVEVTCISRVGKRKGVAIESRSEWIVSYNHLHQHHRRQQQQQHQQQPDINDDVAMTSSESPSSKYQHNRTVAEGDVDDDDDDAQDGPVALSSGRSSKNLADVVTVGSISGVDQRQQTTNNGFVNGAVFISLLSLIIISVISNCNHNFYVF